MSSATTAPTALDPELASRLAQLEARLTERIDLRHKMLEHDVHFLRDVLYEMSGVVKPLRAAISKVLNR